jgi:maltose O-acetyltransferase
METLGLSQRMPSPDAQPAPPPVQRRPRPRLRNIARTLWGDLAAIRPRLRLAQLFVSLLPRLAFGWLRPVIYRFGGLSIGAGTRIYGKVEVEGAGAFTRNVSVGHACMFTTPLYLNASAEIRIGNEVIIGHHVVIITDDHRMDDPTRRCGERFSRPVVVEDGVWVAARATILPGVTLGRGCVVAAGALVTRDVPPHTLVGGVPARPIKTLPTG